MKTLYGFLFGTLRGRLIISVATVHAVMMALFIVDLTGRQRAMLLDRQVAETTALSEALATSAAGWIAANDISGLQELVEAQRRNPEILFVMLADREGHVLADTDKSRQGLYLLDLPREARRAVISGTPNLVDVATPAVIGGRHVGWARVGSGQKAAVQKLAEIIRDGVLYTLAAIMIGSIIAWLMGRRITRRLYAVQQTIAAVHSGNRLARSSLSGADEAAVMAQEFNSMLDALADRDAELHSSEERYRSLIHKVQAAIVLHDGQGKILSSNPLAEELLGLSAQQLLGKELIDPAWQFMREDGSIMPVSEYPVSQVLSSGQPLRGHVTGISRPDHDAVTWVLVNAEPEFDDSGAITRAIVSFVDITGRKQTEKALYQLNRELQAISTCSQALVRAEDEATLLDNICRIVCDEAGYRMAWVGYAENDDTRTVRPVAWAGVEEGYLASIMISWADTARGHGPTGSAIRSGKSTYIQDYSTDPQAAPWRDLALQRGYRSSISLPLKDESAHTFGAFIVYSAEPNAFTPAEIRLLEELSDDLGFGIMVLRARSERAKTELQLRASEQAFRAVVENSPDVIVRYDREGRRIYVNPEFERINHLSAREVLGRKPVEFATELAPMATVFTERLMEAMESATVTKVDLEWTKDGKPKCWFVRIVPEFDQDNNVISALTIWNDISERKQVEEEIRRLNEELEQRVQQRTAELAAKYAELERANRLFVGRELRMIELKERIKELEGKTKGK